jgi:hypothetical protein
LTPRPPNTNLGKSIHHLKLPKSITHDNSTEESTGFNDTTWLRATTKYMDFINTTLRTSSFEKIIKKVNELMASTHTVDSMDVDDIDEVQLIDLSDDECKLFT